MFIFGDGRGASFLEHFVDQECWVCGVSDIKKCKFQTKHNTISNLSAETDNCSFIIDMEIRGVP